MPNEDNKLAEFALKILDPETEQALRAEIESSASSRSALREIEDALTLLADAEQPIAPSTQLRDRVLNALQRETRFAGFAERLSDFFNLQRETIEKHLSSLDHVSAKTWQIDAFPGTHLYHLDGGPLIEANADCGLVYVEPGQKIATHRHLGEEHSFILQGQLKEDNGAIFYPGDYMHRSAGSVHALQSVGNEPLIFAAILIEGLEFIDE